jgi:DNA-binding NarL/FixJ family response regulator
MREKLLLIVDDAPIIISRLRLLLEGLPGLDVILEAGSYARAVDVLANKRPDIVLLDIHLPDRSGIDLLRYIKAHYPEVIVLMFSNQASPFYRNLCERLGAAGFIDKSAEFDQAPTILSTFL